MEEGKVEPLKRTSARIFAGLARSYERVLDFATLYQDRKWKEWASQNLQAKGGERVLDVGSGTLVFEERFAAWPCRFVAVDLSPEMIEVGKEKNIGNVSMIVNGDAEHLPFAEGVFDGAVSCYVPKYVDMRRFASELARVTRPGAAVVLYDFAKPKGPLAPLLGIYIQAGLRLIGMALELLGGTEAYTFRNLPKIVDGTTWDTEVEGAMEEHGFQRVAVRRLTGGAVYAYSGRRRSPLASGAGGEA